MLRTVAILLAILMVAASCSSPTRQNATPVTTAPVVTEPTTTMTDQPTPATPDTTASVVTEATTTTTDQPIPAADQISVSPVFGGSRDGNRFRGGINIVNSSDSIISVSSLTVEYVQSGNVKDGAFLVENGSPPLFLTPGDNWFAVRAPATPIEGLRLRAPEAEYADPPGSFDITVEAEQRQTGTLVSGTVVSEWPSDAEGVFVHVVWFDSSGGPVLGLFDLVIDVEAGESAAFTIETSVSIEESWTYVAYGLEVFVTISQNL